MKTPTLVIVGNSNGNCPKRSLTNFGTGSRHSVSKQLVVYEYEGHHFLKPEHSPDVIQHATSCLGAHLK
jgi:hypothetical protein